MKDALKRKQEAGAVIEKAVERVPGAAIRLVAVGKAEVVSAALTVLMAFNLFTSISRKSITTHEIVRIRAGYYYLVAAKFQLR